GPESRYRAGWVCLGNRGRRGPPVSPGASSRRAPPVFEHEPRTWGIRRSNALPRPIGGLAPCRTGIRCGAGKCVLESFQAETSIKPAFDFPDEFSERRATSAAETCLELFLAQVLRQVFDGRQVV